MWRYQHMIVAAFFLALGIARARGFSIINNDHTNMPFMISLDIPYENSFVEAKNLHSVQSKQHLVTKFLAEHSSHFHGLSMNDLIFQREFSDKQLDKWSMHHFKQHFRGIEVFGGEMKIRFDHEGRITTMNGVLLNPSELASINTVPSIDEEDAVSAALNLVSLVHPDTKSWSVERHGLSIFKHGLTGYSKYSTSHLAFKILVESSDLTAHGYKVFVDAHNGEVLSHFSTVHDALHRQIKSYNWTDIPKTWQMIKVWDEVSNPTTDVTQEMQNILTSTKATYNIFKNLIGYDSFDNNGTFMQMQYAPFVANCPNAFFRGSYVYICPGMGGFDIVAHEWGHAYTSTYGGDLVYQGQPGALNEAFADIIGESTQLMVNFPHYYPPRPNRGCAFNASETLRWIMAEQTSKTIPALNSAGLLIGMRDMYNPNCYDHPATTSDPHFVCNPAVDNGGVHTNSGVPNQAYALFVDGGVLNDITISGVGLIKAFNIYIRALGSHTSTTNFIQHAELLKQACMDFALNGTAVKDPLTGQLTNQIIDSSDCSQLQLALTATGLSEPVKCDVLMNEPTVLVPPPVGKPISPTTSVLVVSMKGQNFNATNGTVTATELLNGYNMTVVTTQSGDTQVISANYFIGDNPAPSVYSVQFEYLGYMFGPYTFQTWKPTKVVKITPNIVQSNTSTWIEIELAEPVREFKGCITKLSLSQSFGDCMRCFFDMVDMAPAFLVDETHVRCATPSYIPSNVTLNVSLSIGPGDFMMAGPQPITFLDLEHHGETPVSVPISVPMSVPIDAPMSSPVSVPVSAPVKNEPMSAPVNSPVIDSPVHAPVNPTPHTQPSPATPFSTPMTNSTEPSTNPSSEQPSTEISPWIVGSIAFAGGVALATGVTTVICLRKAAKREKFEQL